MNNRFVNLLLRWAVLALGVAVSAKLVRGIGYDSGATLAVVALLLALFNAFLKPLIVLFTLPFIVVTLGLGIWFINALLFYGAGQLVQGFRVESFGAALLGALIVSVTNMIFTRLITPPKVVVPPGAGRGPRREKSDDVIDI
ncbi:MAG TPA: phage holin family protein [Candidatus Didemnitutus sp.]|nr:phage holin family protein [Candidatus Didemnitutus sp.]